MMVNIVQDRHEVGCLFIGDITGIEFSDMDCAPNIYA